MAITIIPAVVLRDRRLVRRVGVAHLVAQTVAFAAFVLMPVSGAELRPLHVPTDTLSGWALALNYRIDAPFNCFPSLHVATTTLTAIALARVSRPLGWLGATVAALIAISTLLVKQHYLLDVVGGGLLGAVVATTMLGSRRDGSPSAARRRSSFFGVIAFVALYAAMLGGAWSAYRARLDTDRREKIIVEDALYCAAVGRLPGNGSSSRRLHMAIARYYVTRLTLTNPGANDTLTIRAPNPWTWARVRGINANGGVLTSIDFRGGVDRVSLTAVVNATNRQLEGSRYEILIGDAGSRPDDEAFPPAGQPAQEGAGITLNNPGAWRMDRDPPPPPNGEWAFSPVTNIS